MGYGRLPVANLSPRVDAESQSIQEEARQALSLDNSAGFLATRPDALTESLNLHGQAVVDTVST